MPEAFDEVSNQGEVEVVGEGETHGVVKLVEVPLQGLPGFQHDSVQGRIRVPHEGALALQGEEILLQQRQTRGVQGDLVQLEGYARSGQ